MRQTNGALLFNVCNSELVHYVAEIESYCSKQEVGNTVNPRLSITAISPMENASLSEE